MDFPRPKRGRNVARITIVKKPPLPRVSGLSALVSGLIAISQVSCEKSPPPRASAGDPPAAKIASAPEAAAATAADGFLVVTSLDALRPHLSGSGLKVRLRPGTYRLDKAASPNFLEFTGNDSHFDFTGVKLEVDLALLERFTEGTNMLMLKGNGLVLEGLSLETVGKGIALGGTRAISVMGNDNLVKNLSLQVGGSSPYGYGSFLGIGKGASIKLSKVNGIRVGGDNARVENCRIVMRGMGHGIFIRGAHNTLVRDCHVEGALRKTDDILAETSGPAFERGFKQYTGAPIPPGEMTSLSEDGIRAYDMDENQRRTTAVTVENCTVTRMRRGICLAFAVGPNSVSGSTVTECERAGYNLGSNTTVRNCRGDSLYTQVLDIHSAGSKNADVEIAVLDSRKHYGNDLLAKINGSGHRVVLRAETPEAVPADMTVEVASDRGFGEGRKDDRRASKLRLLNDTNATVVLNVEAKSCEVESLGPVTDLGQDNVIGQLAASGQKGDPMPPHDAQASSRPE